MHASVFNRTPSDAAAKRVAIELAVLMVRLMTEYLEVRALRPWFRKLER